MSRLEVRLLGGFEAWHDGQPISDFESQKVRALLAYLMLHRDSAHSRDRLAGLLWPDQGDDTARRNLRQAIYNLRTILPHRDGPSPPILTTPQTVQFNPETDYWLDVAAFEEGVRHGMFAGGIDLQHLTGAIQLYRGDFLAGFFVTDSPDFEHWLLYEQERLREMAIQALQRLVDYHLAWREYRPGIQYARRLLEIDPLFEEAHRNLMRLYTLSGRRSSALAQYQECRNLLLAELGVEPLKETTALYQAILTEEWPARPVADEDEPTRPHVPFVGWHEAYARLRRSWQAVLQGAARLTLVEGEVGIGKTRLIEAFIQDTVSQMPVVVLWGRCYESAPWAGYQPVVEALRRITAEQPQRVWQALADMSPVWLAEIAQLIPDVRAVCPDVPEAASPADNKHFHRPYEVVASFLEALAKPSAAVRSADPLILFLDDLHWADRSTLDLLQHVVRRLNGFPLWIIAAYQSRELDPSHPMLTFQQQLSRDQGVDRVALNRLSPSDVEQIAKALVLYFRSFPETPRW